MWPYRFTVGILIRRPPIPENTIEVYGVITGLTHEERELAAIQMASVFHPACVMPMWCRLEEITEGVQWE